MASSQEERGLSVAVAVSGRRSLPAVVWAAENLLPHANRALLIHVVTSLSAAPDQRDLSTSPSISLTRSAVSPRIGDLIAGEEQANIRESKVQALQQILPFKKLCGSENQVEILLLDGESPSDVLLRYVASAGIENLVLGGPSSVWFKRAPKEPDVATKCLRSPQSSCNIFIISRHKIITKMLNDSVGNVLGRADFKEMSGCDAIACGIGVQSPKSFPRRRRAEQRKCHQLICCFRGAPDVDRRLLLESFRSTQPMLLKSNSQRSEREDLREAENARLELRSTLATYDEARQGLQARSGSQSAELQEIESLREKLQSTLAMYDNACEKLTRRKIKVQKLSEEWVNEVRRVNQEKLKEEVLKRIVAEEENKYLMAVNDVNQARGILEKEAADRKKAADHAEVQSKEKMKVMEAVFEADKGYKRYSEEEIAAATDNFSPERKIGEGGYGIVYQGVLDHTHVAVKVLRDKAEEKREDFMREVAVLCRLHHPNIVLLLGACPEIGCIVYEYLENGSLHDSLFHRGGAPPLPGHVRFRVLFEVARALSFLHSSAPSPIIHRDLKPGNILLNRNLVAKISDAGLAKFIPSPAPDGETVFSETIIAGTLHYMDPEYTRTGTVRPKSDLYAFGIIALQLLTGRSPAGITVAVEKAIREGSLGALLDPAVTDWPVEAAEGLAEVALRCSQLRCRDRPDLEAEVLPELERLAAAADAFAQSRGARGGPPHFFCPIIQEPMKNPYIASDGFTYEYRAISAWLAENHTSPVTGLPFPDKSIIPNHSLRLAIEEWNV